MDSWTDKQIAMMRAGGNANLRQWFTSKGVNNTLPIRQKYNTPEAELYKERLLATVEGRPLPSELPQRPASAAYDSSPNSAPGRQETTTPLSHLERIPGESEDQYVARQLRLREEAQARLRAKFGPGGLAGAGGGRMQMQGIGSDPNYDPSSGRYGGSGAVDLGAIGGTAAEYGGKAVSALSNTFSYLSTKTSEVAKKAVDTVQDEELRSKIGSQLSSYGNALRDPNLTTNVKQTAAAGWSSLSKGVGGLLRTVGVVEAEPDLMDALKQKGLQPKGSSSFQGFGASSCEATNGNNDLERETMYRESPHQSSSPYAPATSQSSPYQSNSPYSAQPSSSPYQSTSPYAPQSSDVQQVFSRTESDGGFKPNDSGTGQLPSIPKSESISSSSSQNLPPAVPGEATVRINDAPRLSDTQRLSESQKVVLDPKKTEEDFFNSFGV